MKNKLTRKLMLSAFTLLFAVISLGASTYAWFTLSSDAEVKTFEGKVTAGAGLEIQVLGKDADIVAANWQTSVIESDLISAIINKNGSAPILDALTLKDGDITKGFVDLADTAKETGYIVFDLAFRLSDQTNENTFDLYFDGYTLTTKDEDLNTDGVNVAPWRVNRAYTGKTGAYALDSEKTYWVSDAARLGIVTVDKGSYTEPLNPIYCQAPASTGSNEYTEGIPANEEGVSPNAAVNYYNAVNTNPSSQITAPETEPYKAVTSVGTNATGHKIGQLTEDKVVRITVYVWIEGWDGECINAIFAQTIQSTLNFYLDIPHTCVDGNADHHCDTCNKVMPHTHVDDNTDNHCDICNVEISG